MKVELAIPVLGKIDRLVDLGVLGDTRAEVIREIIKRTRHRGNCSDPCDRTVQEETEAMVRAYLDCYMGLPSPNELKKMRTEELII